MGTIIEGLIFDLDNTLLDRQAIFRRVAGEFYEEYLRGTTRVSRGDAVAKMVEWDGDGYASKEEVFRKWTEEWPEVGMDMESLIRWYRAETERQALPDPEVNGYLAHLNEQQAPWGIVTNGSRSQHRKCRAAGLDELAPFIIVSEEAGYAKPDPRIFWDALDALGLAGPERVMFVGDNPVADIDGAKRFGMKAAWIRRGREYPVGLEAPDYVVDLVTEVRDVVDVASR
ncbi:MAG: HAD family hydrolase [Dehalococcoidia bacterium]|nr:HAD family hydrolase [Dehalococcoidia bacterium]